MISLSQFIMKLPGSSRKSTGEEVRTIFVLGFPADVKERELQNLLRWLPGYEASQLSMKGDQLMGFVLFQTSTMAMSARDALQSLVFDTELPSVLRAEMAKKNLYVRRGHPSCSPFIHQLSEPPLDFTPIGWLQGRSGSHGQLLTLPLQPYQIAHSGYPMSGGSPTWAQPSYVPFPFYDRYAMPSMPPAYAPVRDEKDNPPCNTLFVGNLGENTSEEMLRTVFSSQPGFQQMKVLRQNHGTVCFIEFEDTVCAMTVHQGLQGAMLRSSNRGGMRIQYSKNPFGRKREVAGPSQFSPAREPDQVVPASLTIIADEGEGRTIDPEAAIQSAIQQVGKLEEVGGQEGRESGGG